MTNKYKKYALQKDAQIGEVVMTYGVEFVNNPEHKPHTHNQYHPYLVIHREASGKFLALKISSNIKGYMCEFKIYPNIEKSTVLQKTSFADVRYTIELDPQDITENGFILDEQDLNNLYGKIMRLYTLNETSISDENAKKIFSYYISNRKIRTGSVIKVKYCEDYLLVLSKNDKNYTCLPLHRYPKETTEEVKILSTPSYVDYSEEYIVDHEEPFFIFRYYTPDNLFNHIKRSIKVRKEKKLTKEKKNNQ